MTKPYADYGVFRDQNRHTCIRVGESRKGVQIIAMSVTELRVQTLSHLEFEREYTPLPDYTPQRAAERYLFMGDGVHPQVTPEAREHLERLAGPAFVREPWVDEDPPPAPQPKKEDPTMSDADKKPAAPAKRKKSEAPAATPAKKAAPAKKAEAKPAAKKAAAPAKKAEKAEGGGSRGRAPNVAGTAKIKVLVKDNPKRAAAAERFALYKNGMTVDEYLAAGGKRADVNWDIAQGFIEVK